MATTVHAVVYYQEATRATGPTKKALLGLYQDQSGADNAQKELCGANMTPYVNGCVRGNHVVSWSCEVELNKVLDWTLSVVGPGN